MTAPVFNPSRSVVFDLSAGSVRIVPGSHHRGGDGPDSQRGGPVSASSPRSSASAGSQQILLSTEIVVALVAAHPDAKALGVELGTEIAERAIARRSLHGDATLRSSPLTDVADLLGGELALLGFGNLRVERWGAALLFVLDPCALDSRADRLLEGVIEGAAMRAGAPRGATTRVGRAVIIDRDRETIRFFIGNDAAATEAYALYRVGTAFTEIVSTLQERDG